MSNEEMPPSVEEIKSRLKVEIPVEEDQPAKSSAPDSNITDELKNLGRQFAETLQTAWNSQERQKIENEVREGMKSFADEIDKVIRGLKESPATERVREETSQVLTKVESAELTKKAKSSFAQGLQWLSQELGRLSEKFTPHADEASSTEAPTSEEDKSA